MTIVPTSYIRELSSFNKKHLFGRYSLLNNIIVEPWCGFTSNRIYVHVYKYCTAVARLLQLAGEVRTLNANCLAGRHVFC